MRRFYCSCGQEVFFDNTVCVACRAQLGFDPLSRTMLVARPGDDEQAPLRWQSDDGRMLQCCEHRSFTVQPCNWLLAADEGESEDEDATTLCLSCRSTRALPSLDIEGNEVRWAKLEVAKRTLFYSLLRLNLVDAEGAERGMVFDFVEDQRINPQAKDKVAYTGHANGVISINVIEADDSERARMQEMMNERYRTVIGHLRHESGHYYWDRLIRDDERWLARFRETFGDESGYQEALKHYYEQGPESGWEGSFISAYASSHPWEDWAESWAHYMHMMATLETAASFDMVAVNAEVDSAFDALLTEWTRLTVRLNALNRSMGMGDVYPFVLSESSGTKLAFIHELVGQNAIP
ncbi:MAG: putative zinc-binding metallopeptidase [Thiothrix sp.]|nr:putative zinc-binding metallopeptidase [Thiothrix sp.]HPE62012.1 putative zinc-binding metallopeptidase [Thiolinea sp.]